MGRLDRFWVSKTARGENSDDLYTFAWGTQQTYIVYSEEAVIDKDFIEANKLHPQRRLKDFLLTDELSRVAMKGISKRLLLTLVL